MGSLSGRFALVSGASSGIGEATALSLAAAGAAVAVCARREDRLDDLVGRIEKGGGRALAVRLDVGDAEACRAAVARTRAELGDLDVLVANAGVGEFAPVLDARLQDWRTMVETDLLGVLNLVHAALPGMVDGATARPGAARDVVLIGSLAGRVTVPGGSVYSAVKHAVGAFGAALRTEVGERGVRVAVVEPGLVRTEATAELLDGDDEQAPAGVPVPRDGRDPLEAADVGDLVTHLVALPARVNLSEVLVRPTGER